jgi:hypothetical protein
MNIVISVCMPSHYRLLLFNNREIRLLQAVLHPNIVRLLDVVKGSKTSSNSSTSIITSSSSNGGSSKKRQSTPTNAIVEHSAKRQRSNSSTAVKGSTSASVSAAAAAAAGTGSRTGSGYQAEDEDQLLEVSVTVLNVSVKKDNAFMLQHSPMLGEASATLALSTLYAGHCVHAR